MWLFQEPITLSDGVTIYPTKFDSDSKAQSGYKNVGFDAQSNKYVAGVSREQAKTVDGRLKDAQPQNSAFFLGRFADPRVAAWVANNFLQNPPDTNFIDNYLNTTSRNFGRDTLEAMYKINDLNLPEDVFELPTTPGTREYFRELEAKEQDKNAYRQIVAARRLGFKDVEEMLKAQEQGFNTGEEWEEEQHKQRDREIRNTRLRDQDAEAHFVRLTTANPEFKKAWDATGDEKLDAREWAIEKIQNGMSDEELLDRMKGFLNESVLRRILTLSGIK